MISLFQKNEEKLNTPESLWRQISLESASKISDAIEILNKTGLKIVLIVDDNGYLSGTITDGDIRKGLLKGVRITDSVEKIYHREALVVPPAMKRETVLQLMLANKIQQIPIVDEKKKILGVHFWDEINTANLRSNLMIIMAGGQGIRLRPATNDLPKPMLQVAGKPILEHIIEKARSDGFRNFVISIYYLGTVIEEYFRDGSKFGVKIQYLKEASPLGTAGALSLFESPPEEDFIVTNGDVITEISYGQLIDYHRLHDAIGTMAVRLHEIQNPFGTVQTDGLYITGYEEKPISHSTINAGVYAFNPAALNTLSINEACDMPTLFERLRRQSLATIVYPIHEQWTDIGRSLDLQKANSIPHLNPSSGING